MRRRTHRGGLAVALLPSLLALACSETVGPEEPSTLTLSAENVHLAAIGAAYPLHATVADSNGIALSGVAVSWSSDDESIATVDASGRVEAVGVGETQVTAEAGNASGAASVIVTQDAASISISPALGDLRALDDSVRYTATVRDANGNAIPDAAVEWTSSDEAVATVSAEGWATAQANGSAGVTASVGGISDEAAVTVDQVVASVTVSPSADTLAQGETTGIEAAVVDANGFEVEDATVAWTTSDATAAAVDGGGSVTAVGWGADATITATADGVSGTAAVHVLHQIAFVSNRDGDSEIYLMNADGSGVNNLTADPAIDAEPAWSPDGSRIAFRSDRDGNSEIYVMNADGTGQNRLTDDPSADLAPAWSPDGTRIAFMSNRDGDYDVYVMDADGGNMTQLTDDPATDGNPAWSPDGTRIVFRSHRDGDGDAELYVMDADDGTNVDKLTDNTAADYDPAWSPDGTQIAFTSDRDGSIDVFVMDSDGSAPTNLTDAGPGDMYPAWSPDGSRLAFRSDRDGDPEIHVMNVDGTGVVNLTDHSTSDDHPAWRPRP
ncbi:MAG: Ig-like domain-containing protein [Gemmatimonadota bacterium]